MPTTFDVNPDGSFTGELEIAAGTLIGVKKVEIEGDMGTRLVTYIADGTDLDADTRRAILARITDAVIPMAQTFQIDEDRYVAGIDLKVITKGTGNEATEIIVQVRKTISGEPVGDILAEATLQAGSITANAWNSWTFPPVLLKAETEYAICIITESTTHTLGLAKLGDVDTIGGDAVTKQSFKQGNLLTSSNGINYTVHQTEDLMFRIKGCVFSPTTKEVNLGDVTGLEDISDLAILGGIEIPSRDCGIEFIITDPDDDEYTLDKDQVLTLSEKKTGTFNVKANLTGTSKLTPVVFNNTQLIAGEVASSANYFSRMLEAPANFDITVKLEFKKKNNGAVTVKCVESDGASGTQETSLTLQGGTKTTADGWEYRIYKVTDLTAFTSGSITGCKVKITGSGGVADRPYIRNIVAIISEHVA